MIKKFARIIEKAYFFFFFCCEKVFQVCFAPALHVELPHFGGHRNEIEDLETNVITLLSILKLETNGKKELRIKCNSRRGDLNFRLLLYPVPTFGGT